MSVRVLSLAVLLLLASPVTAQLAGQVLEIYPGHTDFASRSNLGANPGELLQGFHASHWAGIGDAGPSAQLEGLQFVVQDQEASTQETFDLVVRSGTDAAGPTPGAAGELVRAAITTPPGFFGQAAWQIEYTFTTPVVIPQKGFFAVGVGVPPAPSWAADGLSVHMSTTASQQAGPHLQHHAWQIDNGGSVSQPPTFHAWRIGVGVRTPTLHNGVFATGTSNYSFGMGGMFPPVGTHGWSTRVDAGATYASGFTAVFLSTSLLPNGLPIPNIGGNLCLGGNILPLPLVSLDPNGQVDLPFLDPLPMFGPPSITVYLQAVCANSTLSSVHFTNVNVSTLQ